MDLKDAVRNMDFSKLEQRTLSILGKGCRVCHFKDSLYYIYCDIYEQAVYLWKDGTFNGSTGYGAVPYGASEEAVAAAYVAAPGFWTSREEAEIFLVQWQADNLEERNV